jgi:hypothetical protein
MLSTTILQNIHRYLPYLKAISSIEPEDASCHGDRTLFFENQNIINFGLNLPPYNFPVCLKTPKLTVVHGSSLALKT